MADDYTWDIEEKKELEEITKVMSKKVSLLESELQKDLNENPTYVRLQQARQEFYSRHAKINNKNSRLRELAKSYTPLERFKITWLEKTENHSNYEVQLLDYQDIKMNSGGIFGVYKRDYCSCSHWSKTFLGFEIGKGGSIKKVIREIEQLAKKGYPYSLDPKPLHLTPLFYLISLSSLPDRVDLGHIDALTRNIRRQ
jgi:hypothetical protein